MPIARTLSTASLISRRLRVLVTKCNSMRRDTCGLMLGGERCFRPARGRRILWRPARGAGRQLVAAGNIGFW